MFLKWLFTFAALQLALVLPSSFAEDTATAPDKWQEAQSFYDQGKYEDALKTLKENPSETGSYYYNLGSVFLKLSRPGPAVAYLERANRVQPHDSSIQQNLKIAKSALAQLIGNDHLDPASSGLESFVDRVSLDEVRGGLGLLGFILILFWFRAYVKLRSLRKTILQPAGFLTLISLGLMISLYAAERIAENHPAAICVEREVIRSGPGDRYLELAQAEPGVKVRLLGPNETADNSHEIWEQVRYSSSGIGWIKSDGLLVL